MKTLQTTLYAALLSASLLSPSALAHWVVDNSQSSLFFISTKNINVSEVHHFSVLSGSMEKDGKFSLDIDLASVETGIEIRNTRMRDMLFNVANFPKATVSATLPDAIVGLANGTTLRLEIPATLSVMGKSKALMLDAQVSKNENSNFVVSSVKPVLLAAADVGLQEGVEALQKIAGLSSIGLTVPVSFTLVLQVH
ncbi:MAG: YceI family protein [Paraglaciecola sp.]|nr:YceI family protein [Paraglaciecola sp.]NCT48794.1 YceI family protein [Paraglaciecola sp.]